MLRSDSLVVRRCLLGAFAVALCGCLGRPVAATCHSDADCSDGTACSGEGHCVAACTLSNDILDFGSVGVGSAEELSIALLNYSTRERDVTVDAPVTSSGLAEFAFASDFEAGAHTVPARSNADGAPGRLEVWVVFNPVHSGPHHALIALHGPEGCPTSLTVRGQAVENAIECTSPSAPDAPGCRFDLGVVPLNDRVTYLVRLENHRDHRVVVTLGEITQPPAYGCCNGEYEASPTSLTIAALQSAALVVSFTPRVPGSQPGSIAFSTDDDLQPSGLIELNALVVGPKIDVQPTAIDFVQVAVDSFQEFAIDIANAGFSTAEDPSASALLLAIRESGEWVEKYPEVSGQDAQSFSVVWPPLGYPSTGLVEGQDATLRMRFAPSWEGRQEAVLTIYSNDPGQPTVEVPLAGFAASLPPCDFDVAPPALNFGSVVSGRAATLSFSIVNRAANPGDACLISMLDLSAATRDQGVFALINGPQGMDPAISIPGGSSLDVPVRFAPRSAGAFTGEIDFFISSPTRPEVRIPLNGVGVAPGR